MSGEFDNFDVNTDGHINPAQESEQAFETVPNGADAPENIKNRGFFGRVSDRWHSYSAPVRALLVSAILLLTLGGIVAVSLFAPLEIRWKLFFCAAGLFVLNLLVYLCIHWKKRILQTVLMSLASLILCVIMLFTMFFWHLTVNKIYNYDYEFPTDIEELAAVPVIDNKITNIALFGIDTRNTNSFSGNSDSIMIMSLDSGKHTVKIVSVMRDSLVPIERNGSVNYAKINSAYARGGPELAVRTLNKLFGLDITEYATVNFYGMSKIIDSVGGIEVELTEEEVVPIGSKNQGGRLNSCIYELCNLMGHEPKDYYITQSGVQHLNGIQAVAYSRIRYVSNAFGTSNDYGRTDRQRYVMEQLFNKALTLEKTDYPSLIKSMIPYTVTSLGPDEILDLALTIMSRSPTFHQARIPQQEYLMRSPSGSFGSVVYYDLDFAGKLIHAFMYDDITFDEYVAANGISKNDWYNNR